MRIGIASDHGGFRLKSELVPVLRERPGAEVLDLGTTSDASTDYPDYAHRLATAILEGKLDRGILVCGTGVGMSIAANRHAGIRCVVCSDTYTARLSRQHNDTNILALGERVVGKGLALDIVAAWLDEAADMDPRHARRREKIEPNRGGAP
ncbi:MAG: ribose 5-phosphate isomerase B [Labilithrix sp.]|nr:ribose 5-phosphate isomerase B [Labilithrix sp.]MBX3222866.1 ribose 5-phosphate isomerase B [Labilithrix sp.]